MCTVHTNDTGLALTYLTIGIYRFRLSVDSAAQCTGQGPGLFVVQWPIGETSSLTNETSMGYIVVWSFGSCFSAKLYHFGMHSNIHSLKRKCLTTGRAAKLLYICHNLKFTEDNFDETLAMCTAAKDVGITNQSVSQVLAAASCENSIESDKLAFSDSRLSTENDGHEQGVSEVWDAEKVSEVGDKELLEIVDNELDDQDEDSEVDETEHSDISFDSGPSEEL